MGFRSVSLSQFQLWNAEWPPLIPLAMTNDLGLVKDAQLSSTNAP